MLLVNNPSAFFRHTGYLKLQETVPDQFLSQMKVVIDQHIQDKIEPLRTNSQNQVVRLDNVIDRAPVFLEVFQLPFILSNLKTLLGPNIELVRNRHNHGTVNAQGDNLFRLHRDVLQWSRPVVTVIIYLEEATCENGCTYIIPGSHFLPFVGTPNNGGTWMDEHSVYANFINQAIPVPMPKGGVLIFDGLVFHTAGENRTDMTRTSVTMAFHSVDELSGVADDPKRLLVLGERIYRGNDR